MRKSSTFVPGLGLGLVVLVALAGCTTAIGTPHHDAGHAPGDAAAPADAGALAVDAFVARDAATVDALVARDAAVVDAAARSCDESMIALPDPTAPAGTDTSCAGCPGFRSVTITPSATTAMVRGAVDGSSHCVWYLASDGCGGTSGAFGPDPEFGMFAITLPLFCGTNRLQLVCDVPGGRAISTRAIDGPSCGARDVQITLAWGATSNDQELHLVREGAHLNDDGGDCTWFDCVHASPDWGVIGDPADDPHKDVDALGTFGPENVYLSHAAPGRYEVMVEYWGSGTTDTPSVTITLDGRTLWHGTHTMNVHDVWDVGTITFPAATFTPVDTLVPCQTAWRASGSHGCALAIP